MERSLPGGLLRSAAALASYHVGGVPPRPVVLRRGRFVGAMMLLRLSQKLGQSRDIHTAESPPRKARLDPLQQPAVAVGIAERDPREVGATFRIGPGLSSLRPGDTDEVALEMEHLTHIDSVFDELGARRREVVDDEKCSLNRARRGCREP